MVDRQIHVLWTWLMPSSGVLGLVNMSNPRYFRLGWSLGPRTSDVVSAKTRHLGSDKHARLMLFGLGWPLSSCTLDLAGAKCSHLGSNKHVWPIYYLGLANIPNPLYYGPNWPPHPCNFDLAGVLGLTNMWDPRYLGLANMSNPLYFGLGRPLRPHTLDLVLAKSGCLDLVNMPNTCLLRSSKYVRPTLLWT